MAIAWEPSYKTVPIWLILAHAYRITRVPLILIIYDGVASSSHHTEFRPTSSISTSLFIWIASGAITNSVHWSYEFRPTQLRIHKKNKIKWWRKYSDAYRTSVKMFSKMRWNYTESISLTRAWFRNVRARGLTAYGDRREQIGKENFENEIRASETVNSPWITSWKIIHILSHLILFIFRSEYRKRRPIADS